MTTRQRIQQEPAYILHHRPFRESSRILDVFSREHGKVALVARGSRGTRSRLGGILRPFMPLRLSWVSGGDMGTLTGAEVRGEPLVLEGDALLSGYYLNELLIRFLHRHDPQPELFGAYAGGLLALRAARDVAIPLRQFEIELLRHVGYALNLDHEAGSQQPLDAARFYDYRIDQGPVAVSRETGRLVFPGSILLAIGRQHFVDPDVLRAARRLLRAAIDFHLGGKELKTRKVLVDIHRR